jgi:hypothetical protein
MDGIALLTTLPLAGLGLKEEIEGLSSSMEDRAFSNVLVQKLRFPAAAAASLFGWAVSLGKFSKGDESRRVGMGARMLLSVAGVGVLLTWSAGLALKTGSTEVYLSSHEGYDLLLFFSPPSPLNLILHNVPDLPIFQYGSVTTSQAV